MEKESDRNLVWKCGNNINLGRGDNLGRAWGDTHKLHYPPVTSDSATVPGGVRVKILGYENAGVSRNKYTVGL